MEVARAFAELRVFEHSRVSGGFRHGTVLAPRDSGEPVLVVAEWDREADYERWLTNPVRERLSEAVGPVLAGKPGGGSLYEEAHTR
jgi:heme-degrading monooxygenase HmoA